MLQEIIYFALTPIGIFMILASNDLVHWAYTLGDLQTS